MPGRHRPLADRFWEKVDKTPGHGPWGDCWLWTGTAPNGYGTLGAGRRVDGKIYAHRVALELALGRPLLPGMQSCHRCDVGLCVNDAHLFEGTQLENIADAVAKGRNRHGCTLGEAHPRAKLTDSVVREIRASSETQRAIAARFGVSQRAVHFILKGQHWKHLIEEATT